MRAKSYFLPLFMVLLLGSSACKAKPLLLNELIDTVPEPQELHIAQLDSVANAKNNIDLGKCFEYEPGVQYYDNTQTHRLLRDRKIVADDLANRRDLGYFEPLRDINVLVLTIAQEKGVTLRSFRLQQERVIEGFVANGELKCEAIANWLNWLKVLSFPDNGYIFVDRSYHGRTPRWIELRPGKHKVQVETLEWVIGEQTVELPGKIQLTFSQTK